MQEIFNKNRMNACQKIAQDIMNNWAKTNSFNYVAKATRSTNGLSLDDLKKEYFAVGLPDNVSEIPLIDMLVVFDSISAQAKLLKERNEKQEKEKDFTLKYEIKTEFSDEEIVQRLSGLSIRTPFDKGKYLRVVEEKQEEE